MLHTKIQPQSFLRTGEEDFQVFLPYMGMAAILFNGVEPFEQSVNIPSTEGPMWNLVKIGQVDIEKTFKDFKVLVLLFVALWFILRGDLFYVLPCVVILFLCFSVILALWLPRLGKRELILVLYVRLFDLCLFGFVGFLFLLVSEKGCGLWLWHSLDFSLTFFIPVYSTGAREDNSQGWGGGGGGQNFDPN